MKTFKHNMGDTVTLGVSAEGIIVGRCEYDDSFSPHGPITETHFYCVRMEVNGDYVWNWHPESEVR